MIANNPHLNNLERPAYELPTLLKNLGDLSSTEPMTDDQRNMVGAIADHASNSTDRITNGLESIGQLLYAAGASGTGLIERHLSGIGELVSYLAVELQHLHDVESDMAFAVKNDVTTKMKKGGAK